MRHLPWHLGCSVRYGIWLQMAGDTIQALAGVRCEVRMARGNAAVMLSGGELVHGLMGHLMWVPRKLRVTKVLATFLLLATNPVPALPAYTVEAQ